jgi:hypothetical protein
MSETIIIDRMAITRCKEELTLPAYMADIRGAYFSIIVSKEKQMRICTFDFAPSIDVEPVRVSEHDRPCTKAEVEEAINIVQRLHREFLEGQGITAMAPAIPSLMPFASSKNTGTNELQASLDEMERSRDNWQAQCNDYREELNNALQS